MLKKEHYLWMFLQNGLLTCSSLSDEAQLDRTAGGAESHHFPPRVRVFKQRLFKGTVSQKIDLAFEDMHGHWSVLGLIRGRGQFLNFFVLQRFYNGKSVLFIAVNAGLRWLNNVSSVYLIQVSLFLIG
jgi:hypothetical protein